MESFYGSSFELSEEINSNDGISNILEINKNDLFNEIDINKIKNENYENNDSLVKIPKEIGNDIDLKKTYQTSKTPIFNFTKNEEINLEQIDNNNINKNEKNNKNTKDLFLHEKNEKLHSKFSIDNIIQKLRIHFIKFGVTLLNDIIKKEFGKQQHKICFLNRELTSNINIDFNKNHFLFLN